MSVMIGIDPHKGSHAAAAVDSREVALAEFEVRATRRQVGAADPETLPASRSTHGLPGASCSNPSPTRSLEIQAARLHARSV